MIIIVQKLKGLVQSLWMIRRRLHIDEIPQQEKNISDNSNTGMFTLKTWIEITENSFEILPQWIYRSVNVVLKLLSANQN